MFFKIFFKIASLAAAFVIGFFSGGAFGTIQETGEIQAPAEEKVEEKEIREPLVKNKKTLDYESNRGFSFSYPKEFKIENSQIFLPDQEMIRAVAVVRYVEEEFCSQSGLSEHCLPFIENPGIAMGVVSEKIDDILISTMGSNSELVEDFEFKEKKGKQYFLGAEGEGLVTILLPINSNKETIIIQYTYDTLFDDDKVRKNYGKDILSSEDQKKYVDQILNTLSF